MSVRTYDFPFAPNPHKLQIYLAEKRKKGCQFRLRESICKRGIIANLGFSPRT
jgi:hypothetical protein